MTEGWVYAPYTGASTRRVSPYWADRYEREASKNWDLFYRRNRDRFFKDRHYLQAEWPELDATPEGDDATSQRSQADAEADDDDCSALRGDGTDLRAAVAESTAADTVLLEAGCGVGNTLFPLLAANERLRCYAFDFAESAVAIVKEHPLFASGRGVAAVGDLTSGALPAELAGCLGRADLCTLMFVLSAISYDRMDAAVRAIASGMREGGLLLFRDYAAGDGAQERLRSGRSAKQLDAGGRFFVRQDGTRAYFFEESELRELLSRGGFETVSLEVTHRQTVNRQKGIALARNFITAKFRKLPPGEAGAAARHPAGAASARAPPSIREAEQSTSSSSPHDEQTDTSAHGTGAGTAVCDESEATSARSTVGDAAAAAAARQVAVERAVRAELLKLPSAAERQVVVKALWDELA